MFEWMIGRLEGWMNLPRKPSSHPSIPMKTKPIFEGAENRTSPLGKLRHSDVYLSPKTHDVSDETNSTKGAKFW